MTSLAYFILGLDRSVGYLFLMRARVAKYLPRTTFHTASPRARVNGLRAIAYCCGSPTKGERARSTSGAFPEPGVATSERSPRPGPPVAGQHQQGYGELHYPEERLIQCVPGRSVSGEHPA
jgi:hypothetical protein